MKLQELQTFLEDRLSYPTDLRSVRTRIGDVVLEAPDESDSRSIEDVLSSVEDETYSSANELFDSILSNLPEGYIGRKYYSDRGGHVPDSSKKRSNQPDQSF